MSQMSTDSRDHHDMHDDPPPVPQHHSQHRPQHSHHPPQPPGLDTFENQWRRLSQKSSHSSLRVTHSMSPDPMSMSSQPNSPPPPTSRSKKRSSHHDIDPSHDPSQNLKRLKLSPSASRSPSAEPIQGAEDGGDEGRDVDYSDFNKMLGGMHWERQSRRKIGKEEDIDDKDL
ncbi:hypothetical protein TrLO_g13511 [Triparma laevis f. longispina]|uniref:Uncharacterized protein n=1 Tax=Triparma laevis f. longispina TaxID=1714387 RepID=A0A9W7KZU3_9STRA|nr:hypothetical protein TrLO_g13511 [Triparma laevis f. longispina]